MNDVDLFAEKGAVAVRGAVEIDWLERLAEGLERNLKEPSPYGCRYTKEGNPGAFLDDYCNWQRIPEYRDFIFESGVGELAARLMGSRAARIFHEHVLVGAFSPSAARAKRVA
ncbi:MAG TPA: hypothetical protein VIE88_13730 [Vicinamibacteria bacterium]